MWRAIGRRTTAQLDEADPVYRKWLRGMMRRRRAFAWIVEGPGNRPAGSGVVWLPETQPRPGDLSLPRPYLMSMYTTPAFRGRGVATQIVVAALAWARGQRYRRFTLHASKMGRPVYERLGFEPGREMIRLLTPPRQPTSGTARRKPLSRPSR
jgi:GNAT superfamily N-acetyltransferase